jgi:hypothetical protein
MAGCGKAATWHGVSYYCGDIGPTGNVRLCGECDPSLITDDRDVDEPKKEKDE